MRTRGQKINPIIISQDRPPFVPQPRHPLHGHQARLAGRWLFNLARRNKVPISPKAKLRIYSWIRGTRAIRATEWSQILDYIQLAMERKKQRTSVRLQIQIGGVGGLSLSRLMR
jgi:hypothetical protein